MAKRDKPSQQPAERPEFPKPLVRLTKQSGGPGGFGCEVQLAADSDGVSSAKEAGYVEVDDRAGVLSDFQDYPKWVYHTDGRRQVVHSQDQLDELDGFTPEVPQPTEGEPATKEVPPPVAAATAADTRNRPPVPADRG